jgi:transcriptional regulator with XRE-family HTH domain
MHVVVMVETVQRRYPYMTQSFIARQVGIAQPHLSAYLAGRGHVSEARLRRLRRWCRGLIISTSIAQPINDER